MQITFKKEVLDPPHPIMAGKTPIAKEFNKRQEALWKTGKFEKYDFEQVTTVLLEILTDDYNDNHSPKKLSKKRVKEE